MNNNNNQVLGSFEYSIMALRTLKTAMIGTKGENKALAWAIGGVIAMLTAKVIECSQEIISSSIKAGKSSAHEDLLAIKLEIDDFINKMLGDYQNE
jgi:urea transporter